MRSHRNQNGTASVSIMSERSQSPGRALGVLLIVGVLVVVQITTAGGSAASPGKTTWKAPYHGSVATYNNNTTDNACLRATVRAPAFFHLRSGHGGFADSSSATACTATV